MQSQFGEKIRTLREQQHLYLRQVAPLLEMDTAQLSKIEKGMRQLKREQIPILADILKASSDELMTLWLADQIYAVVKDEKLANEAMQVAEKKINSKKYICYYLSKNNENYTLQTAIDFLEDNKIIKREILNSKQLSFEDYNKQLPKFSEYLEKNKIHY